MQVASNFSKSSREGPTNSKDTRLQFSTFYLMGRLYGLDVTRVQEIVRALPVTPIPLSPHYVKGLINLRGQIATAIGLRELFGIKQASTDNIMNVVSQIEGNLIAMQVDEIADVVEVSSSEFESTPQTVPNEVGRFMAGVYKTSTSLLSVIKIDSISKYLMSQKL